ncbi:MAG: hypothetical protein Q9224_006099 [Gallowayella concinna]
MSDSHQQELVTRMASLFKSAKYSDLTLVCGGREFQVHRAIVCAASKFFAAACDGNFREAEGKILLPDDDTEAVDRMLTYLYTSKYDDVDANEGEVQMGNKESGAEGNTASTAKVSNPVADDLQLQSEAWSNASQDSWTVAKAPVQVMVSALLNNVLVYSLAEKYDIQRLKELSQDKFEIRAADEWTIEDILHVLPLVYTSTPATDRGLRNIMIRVCLRHMDRLIADDNFREIMHGDATMCFDMLSAVQSDSRPNHWLFESMRDRLAKFEDMRRWVAMQERMLKEIIVDTATCLNCSRPLDLSISNGSAAHWRGPIMIKCRSCKHKYSE